MRIEVQGPIRLSTDESVPVAVAERPALIFFGDESRSFEHRNVFLHSGEAHVIVSSA